MKKQLLLLTLTTGFMMTGKISAAAESPAAEVERWNNVLDLMMDEDTSKFQAAVPSQVGIHDRAPEGIYYRGLEGKRLLDIELASLNRILTAFDVDKLKKMDDARLGKVMRPNLPRIKAMQTHLVNLRYLASLESEPDLR